MNSGPDAQAADWLARLQREDIGEAERAALERWLDADPAHAVAFARTEMAWERAERLRALPDLARSVPEEAPSARRTGSLSRAPSAWRIAAALAVAILGSAFWYLATQWNAYSTGLGERRTVALEDGTQVDLNTASRLEIDFDRRTRAVRLLRGEALFKVARDAQRPFVVEAGGTTVRAIGTAFNVRVRNQVVEVTVTEGVVAVEKDRIAAGSAAVAAAGTVNRVDLSADALRRRVAWRDGAIELKGETLDQAVEEFNRYRKSKLIVADPAIATLRVGGRFETDESAKFVNALKANFAVRAVAGEGGNIYLMGPGK